MNTLEYKLFYERNLPHFQPPGATLVITSRLAGSIPAEVMQDLIQQGERLERQLAKISDPDERMHQMYANQRWLFGRWDSALDKAETGPFWLRDPEIAALVAESVHHRDGKVYTLDAFCIMGNHMHLVFQPLEKDGTYCAMSAIMQSLKGCTARGCNLLLGRQGTFWQAENYDHVVRDEAEWRRIIMYTVNNPVRAGLVDRWEEWPWTYCRIPLEEGTD